MGKFLDFLNGKKTYLLVLLYCVLVISGGIEEGGVELPSVDELKSIVIAGAIATLRAGVAKIN